MELRAQIAEQDMPGLAVGQPATITPVGSQNRYAGNVWLLEPVIDPQSRQGTARIALPQATELRSGGFANVVVEGAKSQRPLLPQSAVLSDRDGNYVLTVGADNAVKRMPVKTGSVTPNGVVILSGMAGLGGGMLRDQLGREDRCQVVGTHRLLGAGVQVRRDGLIEFRGQVVPVGRHGRGHDGPGRLDERLHGCGFRHGCSLQGGGGVAATLSTAAAHAQALSEERSDVSVRRVRAPLLHGSHADAHRRPVARRRPSGEALMSTTSVRRKATHATSDEAATTKATTEDGDAQATPQTGAPNPYTNGEQP